MADDQIIVREGFIFIFDMVGGSWNICLFVYNKINRVLCRERES